jgi:anti-anti-sigma factor
MWEARKNNVEGGIRKAEIQVSRLTWRLQRTNPKKRKKMELNHVQEGVNTIITIKGRFDSATAPVAANVIKEILDNDCHRVLFNLNDLEYLSSSGLRVILGMAKELKRKEGKLILCSLHQFVKEVFVVSGFESLIPIEETVESGIKQLDSN